MQLRQPKMLSQVLEKDLDENTAARRCFLLVQVYDRHYVPANGVVADHMSEETRDIAQAIGFIPVNRIVVFRERRLKKVRPETIDLCEPFPNQTVELGVCPLLRATLNDHRRKLMLQTSGQRDFHQFVAAFFEIDTRHDRQVDRPSEVDEVRIALVLDVHPPFFLLLFRALIGLVLVFLLVTPFA
jgi:hypothetical protein